MKVKDVQDIGNSRILVSITDNKDDYAEDFLIGNLYYDKIKKYIDLRPPDQFSDRFFINFQEGKCTRQPIGYNKIRKTPSMIATDLSLNEPKNYTGHCFRRTAATLLSESGGNLTQIKQMGRWRSDAIAQGYIENSVYNRQFIFNGIVQHTDVASNINKPSISAKRRFTYQLENMASTSTEQTSTYQLQIRPRTSTDQNSTNQLEITPNTKKAPVYEPESRPSTSTEEIPIFQLDDSDF